MSYVATRWAGFLTLGGNSGVRFRFGPGFRLFFPNTRQRGWFRTYVQYYCIIQYYKIKKIGGRHPIRRSVVVGQVTGKSVCAGSIPIRSHCFLTVRRFRLQRRLYSTTIRYVMPMLHYKNAASAWDPTCAVRSCWYRLTPPLFAKMT